MLNESFLQRLSNKKKEKIFRWLTQKSPNIFFRGQDVISITPQITGSYEIRIKQLIDFSASQGLNDFLIDVGANIGLISCQSGDLFKEIHCFEPNPDCFSILKVNTGISLRHSDIFLHNYGLGLENESKTLKVPKENWGGGFIKDDTNSYTEQELAKKEGHNIFYEKDYQSIEITIRNALDAFKELFDRLGASGLNRGFIKIDVEGYESLIVQAIASTLPKTFEILLLFENLGTNSKVAGLNNLFQGRSQAFQLTRFPEKRMGRLSSILCSLRQGGYSYQLVEFDETRKSPDIVFHIAPEMVSAI